MLERFLVVWLSLISLVAFCWNDQWLADPFTASGPYLNYLFAVAMFSIGWLLPEDEIRQVADRWPLVAAGTALQYGSMPLLAYAMGLAFRLSEDALLGTINRGKLVQSSMGLVAALLSLNLAGYAAGYVGSRFLRLPGPMRRALTIEIGTQNAGLGTVLALQLFPLREAIAIPPALYTFGCMLTGTILARGWARIDDRYVTEGQDRKPEA